MAANAIVAQYQTGGLVLRYVENVEEVAAECSLNLIWPLSRSPMTSLSNSHSGRGSSCFARVTRSLTVSGLYSLMILTSASAWSFFVSFGNLDSPAWRATPFYLPVNGFSWLCVQSARSVDKLTTLLLRAGSYGLFVIKTPTNPQRKPCGLLTCI